MESWVGSDEYLSCRMHRISYIYNQSIGDLKNTGEWGSKLANSKYYLKGKTPVPGHIVQVIHPIPQAGFRRRSSSKELTPVADPHLSAWLQLIVRIECWPLFACGFDSWQDLLYSSLIVNPDFFPVLREKNRVTHTGPTLTERGTTSSRLADNVCMNSRHLNVT
jgi:hypothetical protein